MKCFYHNDMDGRCSGSLVSLSSNNRNINDFFEVDYSMDLLPYLDNISEDELVYFVDYSFTENTLHVLKKFNDKCDVIWIDHHDSSIELEKKYNLSDIQGIRSKEGSGALLTYWYLYSKTLHSNVSDASYPYYIKLVSDYDTWTFKYGDNTRAFKYGIDSLPNDVLDLVWERLSLHPSFTTGVLNMGKAISEYIINDNKYYLDHFGFESEIAGHKCLVVNKKTNSFVFGNKINDYDCVVVFVFKGKAYEYNIFTFKSDINCKDIAEQFGGGGHKQAAGFILDYNIFEEDKKE